ncbi:MAG: exopolyphosphatase, partial [Arcobacteraceae bacterium]
TELIIYQNNTSHIQSFPFGIVTLSQSTDQKKDLQLFQSEVEKFLASCSLDIQNSIFISTAGTPTIIAALKHGLDNSQYDKHIINGTTLTLEEVEAIQAKLQSISKEELIVKVGTGREDFINTGMLIYALFFRTLQKEISVVFDDGLREGVALNACALKY